MQFINGSYINIFNRLPQSGPFHHHDLLGKPRKLKAFAGEDVEAAKYCPEDKEFLLEFEPNTVH